MHALEVPESWKSLVPEVLRGPENTLIVGATDVGKSTLCRWLAQQLQAGAGATWLIDADVGQSQLGPPATVGCAPAPSPDTGTALAFFVGDVSPGRSIAHCLGAFSAALRASRRAGAQRIVIDTTGWISGSDAVALKLAKASIVGDTHIILIQAGDELRAFRRSWRGLPDFPLHELRPAGSVSRRSQVDRRAFREAAFRAAFEGAVECEIDLKETAISGAGDLETQLPDVRPGLLLGLNDATGGLLSLGILVSLDSSAGKLTCLCRPQGVAAAEVRIGQLYVQADGTHCAAPGYCD